MSYHPPKHSPRVAQRNCVIEILSDLAPRLVRTSEIVATLPWSAHTMWHVLRDLERDALVWRSSDKDALWGLT